MAARTVTEQASLKTKSASGSRIKDWGPPLTVAVCAPLLEQLSVNQLPLAVTSSLKLIVMVPLIETPVAPLVGFVLETVGGISLTQAFSVPGVTGCSLKSALLTSVSTPSGQREMPRLPLAESSSPTPEPSVYGAPVLPS